MSFASPFQPIQPISSQPMDLGSESLFEEEDRGKSRHQIPFENYLSQALNGVNDSILEAGGLFQKAVAGQVRNLHEVTLAGAETETLLKLATGIASKITTSANTLFQMQF